MGGLGTDGADQHGDQHGGGKSLAADIADDERESACAVANLLEEVAAEFFGGLVDVLDGEAGALIRSIGKKKLLDLAGGFKLAGKKGLTAAGAGEAQDEKDDHGQQKGQVEENSVCMVKGGRGSGSSRICGNEVHPA